MYRRPVVFAGSLLLLLFIYLFIYFSLGVDIIGCFRTDCSFRRAGQSTFSILFLFGFSSTCLLFTVSSDSIHEIESARRVYQFTQKCIFINPKVRSFEVVQLQQQWYNNIVHYNEGFPFSRTDVQTTKLYTAFSRKAFGKSARDNLVR